MVHVNICALACYVSCVCKENWMLEVGKDNIQLVSYNGRDVYAKPIELSSLKIHAVVMMYTGH